MLRLDKQKKKGNYYHFFVRVTIHEAAGITSRPANIHNIITFHLFILSSMRGEKTEHIKFFSNVSNNQLHRFSFNFSIKNQTSRKKGILCLHYDKFFKKREIVKVFFILIIRIKSKISYSLWKNIRRSNFGFSLDFHLYISDYYNREGFCTESATMCAFQSARDVCPLRFDTTFLIFFYRITGSRK